MTAGLILTVDAIAGQGIGLVAEEGNVRQTLAATAVSLTPPLSAGFYVDAATTTPLADQNGSESKPYSTLLAAVTARAGLGGTFYVIPADYSAEVIPALAGTALWSFIGFDLGAFEVTAAGVAPVGPNTILPALTVDASSPSIALRSVKLASLTNNGGAAIFATDVNFGLCAGLAGSTSSILRAQRCYFNGGGVGPFAFVDLDQCGFFGSQSIVMEPAGLLRLTGCYGETSLFFGGAPNTAFVDLYTRQQLSIPAITNGSREFFGFSPPSALPVGLTTPNLTASLLNPQAQIDDIVAAGVTLGFWTDNRVP